MDQDAMAKLERHSYHMAPNFCGKTILLYSTLKGISSYGFFKQLSPWPFLKLKKHFFLFFLLIFIQIDKF